MFNVIFIPEQFERARVEFLLIFRLTKRLQAGMSSAAASEAKAQYSDWLAGCYGWYLRVGNILSILKFMAAVKLKCFSAFLSKGRFLKKSGTNNLFKNADFICVSGVWTF